MTMLPIDKKYFTVLPIVNKIKLIILTFVKKIKI